MRNEPLTGYLLHARAYQEKRAIYQFFSAEHGVVHGMGVRGMPSFMVVILFASGQNALPHPMATLSRQRNTTPNHQPS